MWIKALFISIATLLLLLFGFYKFMTYDRSYEWTILFEETVERAIQNSDFKLVEARSIDHRQINISPIKRFRIKIQEQLSEIDLMNFGSEYGLQMTLENATTPELSRLNIKGYCIGDHVVAIEIEYSKMKQEELLDIQRKFSNIFSNYSITWTKIDTTR